MSGYAITHSTAIIATSCLFDSLQYQHIGIVDAGQNHSCPHVIIAILLQYLALQPQKNEVKTRILH